MSHRLGRIPELEDRRSGGHRGRAGSWIGALALSLVLGVPSSLAAAGQSPPTPSGPVGYAGSRWWPQVEEVDASLRDQEWKRALRTTEKLLDQAVRRSWEEPDLHKVLAKLSVQRAVAEAALGREEAALWHWQAALNLDPPVEAALEGYGEEADLLRGVSLRRQGRLPDGTVPPVRFTTPGYEPVVVVRPPSIGLFENASVRRHQVRPVSLEVVVGVDGRLRQPVVISSWVHPVVVYWTLERCFSADYKVRPARIDGQPIEELEEIDMEFEITDRW